MVQRNSVRHSIFVPSKEEDSPRPSSSIVGEDDGIKYQALMTEGFLVTDWKTRSARSCRFKVNTITGCRNTSQRNNAKKRKEYMFKHVNRRWSAERYARAEMCMLEIMKANKAQLGNKVSRPKLRLMARKQIGDTGLLDHLLKHMDGKVAPGGTERFRRCYNPNGVMEYWLENSDLVDLRHEAGVQDPYWVPPPTQNGEDLKQLKAEMDKMKRDIGELITKKQREDQAEMTPDSSSVSTNLRLDGSPRFPLQNLSSDKEMHEAIFVWKAKTEQQLAQISNSLSSLQDMNEKLENWKQTIELRLGEISDSHCRKNDFSPWFGTSEMNFQQDALAPWHTVDLTIHGDDIASWLESGDLMKVEPDHQNYNMIKIEPETVHSFCTVKTEPEVEQDIVKLNNKNKVMQAPADGEVFLCTANVKGEDLQESCTGNIKDEVVSAPQSPCSILEDPDFSSELGQLKKDLATIKSNMQMVPEQEVDNKVNSASISPGIDCSRLDLDSSLRLLQEMYEGSMKWKEKIEKQVMDLSNTLRSVTA